jgi:hypothetical protein
MLKRAWRPARPGCRCSCCSRRRCPRALSPRARAGKSWNNVILSLFVSLLYDPPAGGGAPCGRLCGAAAGWFIIRTTRGRCAASARLWCSHASCAPSGVGLSRDLTAGQLCQRIAIPPCSSGPAAPLRRRRGGPHVEWGRSHAERRRSPPHPACDVPDEVTGYRQIRHF